MGVCFPGKKCYEGVRLNVISVTWVGSNSSEKSVTFTTLEWPLTVTCQITGNQIIQLKTTCFSDVGHRYAS